MTTDLTPEEMETRLIARFGTLNFERGVFLDEVLPNNDKLIGNVAGGLSQTGRAQPKIQAGPEYLCAFVRLPPGQGTSLHSHGTTETFLVLEGRFVVKWGLDGDSDEGLHQLELGRYDVANIPPGVFRGFRNPGDTDALIYVNVGLAGDAMSVWAPYVIDGARQRGWEVDAAGGARRIG